MKLLWNQSVLRTRSARLSARKSTRKINAYCQSGWMAFQSRASMRNVTRNPAFAHNIQGGIAPPSIVMRISGRSETISMTAHAVRNIVRFAAGLFFILLPPVCVDRIVTGAFKPPHVTHIPSILYTVQAYFLPVCLFYDTYPV
ncbi:MAG: hypothetical protein JXB60_04595 [Candidatus Cloacimonetes bacterium]|nr:hypothetical protein [Candidatus Cloacimonadota bacterium]